MKHKLKPCPCCGCENVVMEHFSKNGMLIKCKSCLIMIKQKVRTQNIEWLADKITKTWNKRVK